MPLVRIFMHTINLFDVGDDAALAAMGARLARCRLNANITQAQLAREAGVSRKVVSQIETGGSVNTRNLVRVLRALGLTHAIDQMVPEFGVSPIQLADAQGRTRQRARSASETSRESASGADAVNWTWRE